VALNAVYDTFKHAVKLDVIMLAAVVAIKFLAHNITHAAKLAKKPIAKNSVIT
jgi:hypothetical protein